MSVGIYDYLLKEDGGYLLQEDGTSKIILEHRIIGYYKMRVEKIKDEILKIDLY